MTPGSMVADDAAPGGVEAEEVYLQKERSMPDAWMMKPEVAGTRT